VWLNPREYADLRKGWRDRLEIENITTLYKIWFHASYQGTDVMVHLGVAPLHYRVTPGAPGSVVHPDRVIAQRDKMLESEDQVLPILKE